MNDLDQRLRSDGARDGIRFSESRHARLVERARDRAGEAFAAATPDVKLAVGPWVFLSRLTMVACVVVGLLFGKQWLATPEPSPDGVAVARALSTPMTLADRAMSVRPDVIASVSRPYAGPSAADAYNFIRVPIEQLRALAVQTPRSTADKSKAMD